MAVRRPNRRFPRRFGLLAALSALIAVVLGIVPAAASETAAVEVQVLNSVGNGMPTWRVCVAG